jgi:hypothetical protein
MLSRHSTHNPIRCRSLVPLHAVSRLLGRRLAVGGLHRLRDYRVSRHDDALGRAALISLANRFLGLASGGRAN